MASDREVELAMQDAADFKMGVKSINEIRVGRGLNPIEDEGGDKHWIQANNMVAMTPIPAWSSSYCQVYSECESGNYESVIYFRFATPFRASDLAKCKQEDVMRIRVKMQMALEEGVNEVLIRESKESHASQ